MWWLPLHAVSCILLHADRIHTHRYVIMPLTHTCNLLLGYWRPLIFSRKATDWLIPTAAGCAVQLLNSSCSCRSYTLTLLPPSAVAGA